MFAWVVGRPIGSLDLSLPAALPTDVLEDDVRDAYNGLMTHVAQAVEGHDWPELHRTAVLWRLAGIAEGLQESKSLHTSMDILVRSLSATMPVGLYNRISRGTWLSDFVEDRNGFTHVRPDDTGRRAFQASLVRHASAAEIVDYLRVATYFAAGAINTSIRRVDSSKARSWMDRIDDDYSWVT